MLISEGSGYLIARNEKIPLKPHQLYFVNPHTPHTEISDSTLKYYVLKMDNFTAFSMQDSAPLPVFAMPIHYQTQTNLVFRFSYILEHYDAGNDTHAPLLVLELAYLRAYFIELLQGKYKTKQSENTKSTAKLQAVVHYILSNYHLDLKVEELAKNFSFSHNHLIYCFKKEKGVTPMEFITSTRIDCAKQMLRNSDFNVSQIASMCGYSSPAFFGKTFKKITGISPSAYRKNAFISKK
jgi:AraC-like DNA-binding protein